MSKKRAGQEKKFMQLFGRLLDLLRLGALETSSSIALVLTFLTTIDVAMRYTFARALPGTLEISQVLLVILVFLSLAQVQKNKEHITIDFLFNKAPSTIKFYWEIGTYFVSLGFFLILFWESIAFFRESLAIREYFGTAIRVPIFPGKAAIVIGSGLAIIELIRDITRLIVELTRKKKSIRREIREINH
jgi:TRAP-type C4-dicarboxylate transport system permease small subunit